MRKAREKWLTERSNSAAIFCSERVPPRSELELFAGALRLPRSKAAARRSAARPQSAIRLSDVCRERKHHVIDEKLVRFGRPTQSPQQRRADVRHNLVVEAGAELTVELADAPDAGLLRNAVECQSRNIEMKGVEWLIDHKARIALHVVQICRACPDIGLGHALAMLPVFAVRVVAKLQADDVGILGYNCAAKARNGIVIPRFGGRDLDATHRPCDQR